MEKSAVNPIGACSGSRKLTFREKFSFGIGDTMGTFGTSVISLFYLKYLTDYVDKAVSAAIFCHIFEKAKEKGIHTADGSTIGELNMPSRLSVEKLGGRHYRTYRTYKKHIVND